MAKRRRGFLVNVGTWLRVDVVHCSVVFGTSKSNWEGKWRICRLAPARSRRSPSVLLYTARSFKMLPRPTGGVLRTLLEDLSAAVRPPPAALVAPLLLESGETPLSTTPCGDCAEIAAQASTRSTISDILLCPAPTSIEPLLLLPSFPRLVSLRTSRTVFPGFPFPPPYLRLRLDILIDVARSRRLPLCRSQSRRSQPFRSRRPEGCHRRLRHRDFFLARRLDRSSSSRRA